MGSILACPRGSCTGSALDQDALSDLVSPGTLQSQYQQRVEQLACEATELDESLEVTLRRCIDFCYGGGVDWAPHVRVNVYADNPIEHQSNVPVYSTLLSAWGLPLTDEPNPPCRAVQGTDVQRGYVVASPFWQRSVGTGKNGEVSRVLYRDMAQTLLFWFLQLPDSDARKQLLVNIVLQLHEACYNCIGRHKEVFELCIYDLLDAEFQKPGHPMTDSHDGCRRVVQRHACRFLDRHKRDALHATTISPLKFVFQNVYEVFENLDSHGASFWTGVFSYVFFLGLDMPYESIVELDTGWTWAAVDFLALMKEGDAKIALDRFAARENFGRDWRQLARGLRPPQRPTRKCLPGMPYPHDGSGFEAALSLAKQRGSRLNRTLIPYAERFASALSRPLLLEQCALGALGAAEWDTALGPALSALSAEALGVPLTTVEVRHRLLSGGDAADATAIQVDIEAFASLLHAAGVAWAQPV